MSGGEHCDQALAVEVRRVRQRTLREEEQKVDEEAGHLI